MSVRHSVPDDYAAPAMMSRQTNSIFATYSILGRFGTGGPAAITARVLGARCAPCHVYARGAEGPPAPGVELDVVRESAWRRAVQRTRLRRWLPTSFAAARRRFDRRVAERVRAAGVAAFDDNVAPESLRRAAQLGARTILLQHNLPFRVLRVDQERERSRWGGAAPWVTPEMARACDDELAAADYVVAFSEHTRTALHGVGVAAERVRRVRLGVDLERFRPSAPAHGHFTAAFVGWLALRKGYPYLLEAFAQLGLPNTHLVFHGGSSLRFHHDLVSRLAAGTSVEIRRGPVEPTYAQASVVVLPSVSDGFGLVVLEAMACGRPVIVADGCGAAEIVDHGRTGFVVPARDPDAIATALRRLHEDEPLRHQMGRAARLAAESFPWSVFEEDMLRVVDEAAGGQS